MNLHRHHGRASHFDNAMHARPSLTREELRDMEWDYDAALRASRRRGIAISVLMLIGGLGVLAYLAWP
jgi:hypothetical protein